jgi:SSS family transporter
LGGDDGSQAALPLESRTGFRREILAYHTITDTWTTLGELPFSLVTTPTVPWRGRTIIPGGEMRPGVRSTDVWTATVVPGHTPFGFLNYAALVAYLLGMIGIGWYCSKRNQNTEDYFVASGRIPWWATGLSIYATMLSSITFMAVPAKAFATDWTFIWASVPLLVLAPIIIRYYLPFYRQLDCASAYEYLEKRFNVLTRLYASAAFIIFQLGRQAYVLLLPSLALAAVTDLDVQTCIIIMGLLCVAYTVMGGMEAVVWTDVVQSIVLLGGALLGLAYIIGYSGYGFAGAVREAAEHGKLNSIDWTLDASSAANALWVILVSNTFVTLISYTSDQAVVQRYMTTENERQAGRAIWTNALLTLPSAGLFFAIGTALWVYYRAHPDRLDPTQPTDAVFPAFIVGTMPAGIAGVVIAGIFAAAQSTVSGSLNSVATAVMTDFYERFGGRAEGRFGLRLARILTAVIGVFATLVALLLASLNLASLWDGYLAMISLLCSGLAGLFALGIFTRSTTGAGAMVGALSSAGLLYLAHRYTTIHFFMYATIGVLSCFVIGWLASQVLPKRRESLAGLTIYDRRKRIDS